MITTGELQLVDRARSGDADAFEVIFTGYQERIYNYVLRMMGSSEDARDLTQDVFLKAYVALPKTAADLKLSAWLYRIATNVCLDELRRRKLKQWLSWDTYMASFHPKQVAVDNPEREVLQQEAARLVQRVLVKLSPRHRLCLLLHEHEDLSCDEIADVLGTTKGAVKSLLFRAREEFRRVYRSMEPVP